MISITTEHYMIMRNKVEAAEQLGIKYSVAKNITSKVYGLQDGESYQRNNFQFVITLYNDDEPMYLLREPGKGAPSVALK